MFEPVVVPGSGERVSPAGLRQEIQDWVASPPLRALLDHFKLEAPSGSLDQQLVALDKLTAAAWDFRRASDGGTQERNQVDLDAVSGDDEELVVGAANALGLVQARQPRRSQYDHIVVLGGLVRANVWRSAYAAYLVGAGVTTSRVVGLSAYRRLAVNLTDPSRDEPTLLEVFGLPPCDYECEVMDESLRRAFGLAKLVDIDASPPGAAEDIRYRIASATGSSGVDVTLVVAPPTDPASGKRADTAATYRYWAGPLQHISPGDSVLVITSTIYVPYHHVIALQHLALPFGAQVETVGVDHEVIDNSISPQAFRAVNFLQEIRSTLRACRSTLDLLDNQSEREAL